MTPVVSAGPRSRPEDREGGMPLSNRKRGNPLISGKLFGSVQVRDIEFPFLKNLKASRIKIPRVEKGTS
jgi:hypothetical protein